MLVLNGAEHELDEDDLFENSRYEISDESEDPGSNPGESRPTLQTLFRASLILFAVYEMETFT